MKSLGLLLTLLLFTCDAPPSPSLSQEDPAQSPAQTSSAPAPGVTPRPTVSGDLDYRLMELDDLEYVEGCSVLLSPDGAVDGYVLGFGFPPSSAEGNFGGSHQILSYVSEKMVGNQTIYVHSNENYEVTTTLVKGKHPSNPILLV